MFPLANAFCSNGLGEGEKGVPAASVLPEKLVLAVAGDEPVLSGLAGRDVESRYFGGVT